MDTDKWDDKQEPYTVYNHFIKKVFGDWDKDKMRLKYHIGTKKDLIERLKPKAGELSERKTIICKKIENINLELKKAIEFIKLNNIKEDFSDF